MTKSKLLLTFFTLMALQETAMSAENARPLKEKVSYEKSTKLNFDETVVDGQFQSPDAQLVDSERNVYFESMMEPKHDFNKELKRSSGAIR